MAHPNKNQLINNINNMFNIEGRGRSRGDPTIQKVGTGTNRILTPTPSEKKEKKREIGREEGEGEMQCMSRTINLVAGHGSKCPENMRFTNKLKTGKCENVSARSLAII